MYDEKCFELAAAFIEEPYPEMKKIAELAQGIQDYIEAWLEHEAERRRDG
jgi:hypothetical protein